MLFGRVFILIFTYAIVQIECNSTQWAAEYQLPYQLNFTDNQRFEIGCVVVAYLRLPEYAQIHLIDRSGNTFGRWGATGVICYEKAILDECTNHGDISEVIIERVEGGYNVIMNGKRRNEAVFPNGDEGFMGTEADYVLVRSETGKNFDVTGITVLCPDPPEL